MTGVVLVIVASCPLLVDERAFTTGQRSALQLTDAGLAVDMMQTSAGLPDAGLAVLPGSTAGLYVSPIYDVGAVGRAGSLRFGCAEQCGRPLPDDGGVETTPGGADMRGNRLLFHFDEEWSGARDEVRDSSGFGHHGTVDGGRGLTVPGGIFGRAAVLDGGQCIFVPDRATLDPSGELTIAVWFSVRALSVEPQGLFAKRVDYQQPSAYTLYLHTGDTLWADVDTEDNRFQTSTVIQPGRWTHVAMVYDGALPAAQRVRVFIDGQLDTTATESSAAIAANDGPLGVGCLQNPAMGGILQGFDGLLDEAAVWHRALGSQEISGLYERGRDRVIMQARSCTDATCSADPPWSPYFVVSGGPLQLPDARYFQFRAWLESYVVLSSVTIDVQCPADDGGTAMMDAGTAEPTDAGTPGPGVKPLDVRCGCGAAPPWLVLLLLLVLPENLRRRPPRPRG